MSGCAAIGKRRGRRFGKNTGGTEGFFEEAPALAIVIIGLTIFLSVSYSVYTSVSSREDSGKLADDCRALLRAFRSSELVTQRTLLTMQPVSGHLDFARLCALNNTALGLELSSRYQYNVTVEDKSTGDCWHYGATIPPGNAGRATSFTAVVIHHSAGDDNPGTVLVVMWK